MRPEHVLSIWLLSSFLYAAEPEPTLRVGAKSYTASELLKRPEVETIKVKHDPAYGGRETQYQAIAVRTLFDEAALHNDEVVQFRCRDGFVASISTDRITQNGAGRSVAYLAIEDPKSKWPDLTVKGASGTAGPFYLVWVRPELSGILQEEWPYQVVAFEIKGKLRALYPGIFPKMSEDVHVARGLKLFQQTCFACHTVNRQGPSQVGPDLNLPLNPTEYLKDSILPRYIRDPKALRSWEGSKMPGFGPEVLSNEDIANIVAYLKEMSVEKDHHE
jgi:mono/diheme cytochrome c family protein